MKDYIFTEKSKSNSVKSKKFKFYELENSSSTFQNIISKYRKKRKRQKEKKNIAASIEKARYKAERLETENEYIMKELRNNIKLEQELIALFGPRAKKHYNDIDNITKKFTSKINKYDFFNPKEMKRIKEVKKNNNKTLKNKIVSLPELNNIIFKGRKNVFSPTIMSKNKTSFFNIYSKNLRSLNTSSSNSTKFKSFYTTATNMRKKKKYINFKPYNTFDANDNHNINNIENYRTHPNRIMKNKKKYFNTENENFGAKNELSNKYFSMNTTLHDNKTNYDLNINKIAYLDNLSKINKQFMSKEKRIINHFRNNDYGCNFFKLQFRYLSKKYFN